jgi:hypothetical protein
MPRFSSTIREIGPVYFPLYSGTRVMMMPIRLNDLESTMPKMVSKYHALVATLVKMAPVQTGIGYLTIDEKEVLRGQTHRQPGIHVDGVGPDGGFGSWGGGSWGRSGMVTASTRYGCRAWQQEFIGQPLPNGDCSNLAGQCIPACIVGLQPNTAYWLNGMTVHEGAPFDSTAKRQFIRISMPSDAPWYVGYTENPLGVMPTGPIHPPRPARFMEGMN